MNTATTTGQGQTTAHETGQESRGLRTGARAILPGRSACTSIDEVYGRLHRPGMMALSAGSMKRAVARRMKAEKA